MIRINLVVSDQRILIYSGSDRGLHTGQKLKVFRGQRQIGLIELTEVHSSYSVARVVSKTEDLQDMDVLGAPAPEATEKVAASKSAATGKTAVEKKTAVAKKASSRKTDAKAETTKKETKESAEKKTTEKKSGRASSRRSSRGSSKAASDDDKKSDAGKSSSRSSRRRSASKSGSSEDASSGDSEKKSTSSRSRGRSKSSSSAADKSSDKDKAGATKTEKAAKEKLKVVSPLLYKFPTSMGGTGLWTVPTADILDKGHYAASYYRGWYSAARSGYVYGPDTSSYIESIDYDEDVFSMTYGLGNRLEVYFALTNVSITSVKKTTNMTPAFDRSSNSDLDGNAIGIKYNPGKNYVLKETTHKKWDFALGGTRVQMDNVDGSEFYGVVSLPLKKFNMHAGLFYYNLEGMSGKNFGTMMGVEFPLRSDLSLIGEGKLFQSNYTWNAALRYIYQERGALLLGISDTDDTQVKQVGLSYSY